MKILHVISFKKKLGNLSSNNGGDYIIRQKDYFTRNTCEIK